MSIKIYLLATAISFIASVVIIPLILTLSHRKGWYDFQDSRKIHDGNIPRLGGVGIALSFFLTCICCYCGKMIDFPSTKIIVLLVSCLSIHVVGLHDDFKNLRPRYKFFWQIVTTVFFVSCGFHFKTIIIPFSSIIICSEWVTIPITIIWILGITNAINLIDGLDGLSSTIAIFAALTIGLVNLVNGDGATALFAFAILGSVAGFLVYNKPKAKIFMGDSGSLLVGFILAALPVLQIETGENLVISSAITILIIPIVDTLFAMSRRIFRGIHIATPDKEHLHHMLLDFGLSNKVILGLISLVCIAIGLIMIFVLELRSQIAFMSGALVIIWALFFLQMYLLHRKWKKNSNSNYN